jgi:DedD protein
METRLKERLTGAAILVALIVLVVPELFHGQRPDAASNTSSGGEGPPLRSYTIDLSNGPARKAPLQSTESTSESAAGAPGAATSGAATPGVTTPVAPPPVAPPPVAPTVAPTPAITTGSGAAVSAAPKSRPPAAAASPPVPSIPAAPNHAAAKSASAASWSVQLGLFASRENAERLMHSAQSKGFPVSVSDADAKGLYHVVAAGLADRAAAQTLQGRLQTQGFQAALVAPQSGNLKSSR